MVSAHACPSHHLGAEREESKGAVETNERVPAIIFIVGCCSLILPIALSYPENSFEVHC